MIIICPKCSISFDNYSKYGSKKFCSRKCANSRGPRTTDFKNKVSIKLSGRKLTTEHKLKITGEKNGSFKNAKKSKTCQYCGNVFLSYRKNGEFCSKNCWINNTNQSRTNFEIYKAKCQFNFNVFDYPEYFDLNLIKDYGFYSPTNKKNNPNGISKDHMYSIRQGFDDNIDPYYISHPANCKLVFHKENQQKRTKCSISFEELRIRVENFNCERGGMVTHRIANP